MALITIYGINGVGKDTVANSLRDRNTELSVSSISRMLMYILGITKTYDVNEKVCEEQYKVLESIPQEKMLEIENTDYKKLLYEISNSKENLIMLSHLISVLRHGDKIQYLIDRITPNWYVELNQALIQLVAPTEVISERRKNDLLRKRDASLSEIEYHQSLCTNEWERIKKINIDTSNKMFIVNNIDLDTAISDIETIMYDEVKVLKKVRDDNKWKI